MQRDPAWQETVVTTAPPRGCRGSGHDPSQQAISVDPPV